MLLPDLELLQFLACVNHKRKHPEFNAKAENPCLLSIMETPYGTEYLQNLDNRPQSVGLAILLPCFIAQGAQAVTEGDL